MADRRGGATADYASFPTPVRQMFQSASSVHASHSLSVRPSRFDSPSRPNRRASHAGAPPRVVPTEVAHHPPPRFADQVGTHRRGGVRPDPPQRVGLFDEPPQLRLRARAERVLEHRRTQFESRAVRRQFFAGGGAELFRQNRAQIVEADAPARPRPGIGPRSCRARNRTLLPRLRRRSRMVSVRTHAACCGG